MGWKPNFATEWQRSVLCALLVFFAGYIASLTPLARLSYELPFRYKVKHPRNVPEALIIYMDENSYGLLDQSPQNWDRSLHAKLIDHLTSDGVRLIALDIRLTDPGDAVTNVMLANAIKKSGRVVLAAGVDREAKQTHRSVQLLTPRPEFQDVAAGWGISEVVTDGVTPVGQVSAGESDVPSFAQAAALVARPDLTNQIGGDLSELWLNYYGPPGTIRGISYVEATDQPAGSFREKLVFVGAKPKTLYPGQTEPDKFPTPFSRWRRDGELMPGVELMATATLNLARGEWLTRISKRTELLFLLLTGILLALRTRSVRTTVAVSAAVLAITLIAVWLRLGQRVWFSWLAIVACQIPVAVAVAVILHRRKERTVAVPIPKQSDTAVFTIPDHALLFRVGEGAYGEVWLARNILGEYRAVKLVHRHRFPNEEPYEREFKGIQRYSPISRSHPGWVNILHVGRDDRAKFFFYIMEAGDDQTHGQKFEPAAYKPKTLASELEQRGRLPLAEVVQIGIALSAALEHLHQHGLIHRDIKPSNVIFVAGAPKFTDIGLVTEIRTAGKDVSFLGTDGYIAPEGPGTPSSDLYSLGKLLYEIGSGRDRREFPELSTSLLESSSPEWQRFEQVLLRTCEVSPSRRYQTATELQTALSEVQKLNTAARG